MFAVVLFMNVQRIVHYYVQYALKRALVQPRSLYSGTHSASKGVVGFHYKANR